MGASFVVDAEAIADDIRRVASESVSEEDVRQGVEYVLRSKVVERLKAAEGVEIPYGSWRPPKARYEVTLVSGARLDALYGHLIIEYEKPKTFETKSGFERAVEQVKGYIRDHAEVEARFPRYFGVVLDGYKIGFVRYREAIKGFESKGPFEVNKNTVAKLVEAIIGLRRKALSAEELLKDFGPESSVANESIKILYGKMLGTSPRTQMLFEDWRRVFSQVCAYSPEKIKGLEEVYGFGKGKADPEKLLFALHTYYALIMKLLAAEVASLYVAPRLWSYLKALEDAYYRGHERLREELKQLEEGGIFAKLGITNFMEADYFAWYLDEWDEGVARCIMGIVNRLSNYDPSAAELEPERVKDLFKRLYQNLVPKKIRHDLGEYYTPDWLAELVLNEVGWTVETFEEIAQAKGVLTPLDLRLLDPACGSGTFLVLAIGRLRGYIEEHWIDKGTALKRIVKNIVGFDLNPLAVIASRANYLISLGDMLRERGGEPIEIPIYLTDSILVERRQTLAGATYILKTAVGEFNVPTSVVEKGMLAKTLTIIEDYVRGNYSINEFKARLLRDVSLDENEVSILMELFETLSKLEREGKNRIWTRVLKNSFAPFFAGKFDYVVGNPPWVNWESLPEDYRNTSKVLWDRYGLLEKTKGMGLGKVKRDVSSLFLAACFDRYLADGGGLSFLMPFTILKTHASAGFRKFLALKGRVVKIHDTVELFPFEGAINRTCLIHFKKEGRTDFPIPCVVWNKSTKGEVPTEANLKEVTKASERYKAVLAPIKRNDAGTPWMIISEKAYEVLQKIMRPAKYRAYAGVYTGLDGVYYIDVLSRQGDNLLIQNMYETGKKKIKQVQSLIEPDVVYPLVRGRDVKRWFFDYSNYIIIPTDEKGMNIPIQKMKVEHPKVYEYFLNFFNELVNRGGEPYKTLLKPYREVGMKASENTSPFYMLFNVLHAFSQYKVVWKNVAGKISGKAEFSAAVVGPIKDEFLGEKIVIPNVKLMFIPLDNEDEAHYICAVLNSSINRLIVASYVIETGISTHILQNVFLPKFDKTNIIHLKLSFLSKKAHKLAQQDKEDELKKVEEDIDNIVAQLYDISQDELKEITKCLSMLQGGEFEEEEEESVELPPSMPDVSLRNNIVEGGKPFNVDVVISNPLDKPLSNASVNLKLFDGRFIEKSFESVKDEVSFPISFDGLKPREYMVKAVFEYVFDNVPKRVEKDLTIYVKGSEVRHVERGFKPEELLGV